MSDVPRDPGAAESSTPCSARTRSTRSTPTSARSSTRTSSATPTARAEVDELRETAASLALLPARRRDAPPELWERIAGDDRRRATRPATPTSSASPTSSRAARRSAATRSRRVAVAAAIVVVVVLAVQVVSLHGHSTTPTSSAPTAMAAAFDQAAKVDGARAGRSESRNGRDARPGRAAARRHRLPRGDDLEPLPTDRRTSCGRSRDRRTSRSRSRPACSAPTRRRSAFRASGPVSAFARHRRAGGRRRDVRPSTPIAQAAA